jgi:K319-like protein
MEDNVFCSYCDKQFQFNDLPSDKSVFCPDCGLKATRVKKNDRINRNPLGIRYSSADDGRVNESTDVQDKRIFSNPTILWLVITVVSFLVLLGVYFHYTQYVSQSNKPPVADAGPDQVTSPGYGVVLNGTPSNDPDNDPIKYQWIQIAGSHVKLDGANAVTAFFTAPSNISSNTDLMFRLIVTDSKNATGTVNVKVTDKFIPLPPDNNPNLESPQELSACDNQIIPGIGEINTYSGSSGPGLRIYVNVTAANFSSPPGRITVTGPSDESLCYDIELTTSGESILFYFYPGVIPDGQQFEACITLLGTNNKNCVNGLNHQGGQRESVQLNSPF